jgi:hypothetical protein
MGALRLAAFSVVAILVATASPAAQAERVPPGLSGADQYVETLPAVTGNEPTSGGGGGGAKGPPQTLSRAETEQALGHSDAARLNALGPDGQAAARLAAAKVPPASAADTGAGSGGGGSSGLGQVIGQLTGASDSGGVGLLQPLLIAVTAIAATAFALGRRRTGRKSQLDG